MISDAYFTRESTCIAGLHKLLKHYPMKIMPSSDKFRCE